MILVESGDQGRGLRWGDGDGGVAVVLDVVAVDDLVEMILVDG